MTTTRPAPSPGPVSLALGITLTAYLLAPTALITLGTRLGDSPAPLADDVTTAGRPQFAAVVRAGAAVATVGSLLALLLGVSRTTLAMARDRHLPHALATVHPRFPVPHRAELAVGAVVAVVAANADIRAAIGFSSFAVLLYCAIANASAWTLNPNEGWSVEPGRRGRTPPTASGAMSGRCALGATQTTNRTKSVGSGLAAPGRSRHRNAPRPRRQKPQFRALPIRTLSNVA